MPLPYCLQVGGEVLEQVAVDVGGRQDHLVEAHARRQAGPQGLQHAQERHVAHAVRDHADALGAGILDHQREELAQVGLGLLGAFAVVVVAGDAAGRGPAVEQRRAVELEVVGHLRGAEERVVELGVVAVHEHHGLVLERVAAADPRAGKGDELLARQRLQLLHREVLLGVLGLLVDGDVDVGDADGEGALDVGHLVASSAPSRGRDRARACGLVRRCRRRAWAHPCARDPCRRRRARHPSRSGGAALGGSCGAGEGGRSGRWRFHNRRRCTSAGLGRWWGRRPDGPLGLRRPSALPPPFALPRPRAFALRPRPCAGLPRSRASAEARACGPSSAAWEPRSSTRRGGPE